MIISKAFPVIFSLITMFAQAQDSNDVTEGSNEPVPGEIMKKITGRKAWFLCTAIPENVQNPVSVMVEDKIHEVTLSIRNMSDPFPVRGEGIVKIVKEVPNPEKPNSFIFEVLAEAKVPDHIDKALIILVPAIQKEGRKLLFMSKVLDLKDFKGGDYLYLNLSPKNIGITLGEERSVLKPGELKIQNNREVTAAVNKVFSIHYQSPEEDKWKMIVATTIVVQPTRREICILHWDEKAGRVDYRGATFPVETE